MHSNLPYYNDDGIPNIFVNPEGHIGGACCDEAEQCADWYPPQKWNTGSITPIILKMLVGYTGGKLSVILQ